MEEWFKRISKFLRETIWFERIERRRFARFVARLLQVSFLVGKGFLDNQCFLRASALSYTVLLSLVPFLAFAFSILKGLGVEEQVQPFIVERVAAGQQDVVKGIVTYISNTNMKALGALGLITLLYTVVKVLSTVENTFNDIWGVTQGRTWLRKVSDYTSVVVIAPVLLVTAMGVSAYIMAHPLFTGESSVTVGRMISRVLAKMGPYALTWVAFTAFYAFMPNTQVRFASAIAGGIVGGTLWQAAFWGYTTFQVGVARYNAIYTSFAALPVFLVWLYVSWVVALFGAEVAFATGHLETYRKALQHFSPSAEARERLALRVYLAIARAFHSGERPQSVEVLATETKVPVKAVREIVSLLLETGHLSEVQGVKVPAYQPARDLAKVTPAMILATVRKQGDDVPVPEGDALWQEAVNEANVVAGSLGGLKLSHSMAEILEGQTKSKA